jgi:hypothetical protein
MYIMHSCPLSHIYEQFLLKPHFHIIFRVKNNFEPNVFKWVIKKKIVNSSLFALLIINIKILSNFQQEWCTFGFKKWCLKKTKIVHFWSLSALNMKKYFWFVSNFERVNFAINEKYSKKRYDNPNYYVSLVIFQTFKNAILRCPLTRVAPLAMILPC